MTDIYQIVKELRNKKNITQVDMASKLDMSQNNYSRLERGEIVITVERLKQISDILEVSVSDFFKLDDSDFINESYGAKFERIENTLEGFKNEKDKLLKDKIKLLNDKVNFLHDTTIGLEEIRNLVFDIEDKAKKGLGLTKLEYDMIKKEFITEYKPLKP